MCSSDLARRLPDRTTARTRSPPAAAACGWSRAVAAAAASRRYKTMRCHMLIVTDSDHPEAPAVGVLTSEVAAAAAAAVVVCGARAIRRGGF